MNKKKHIFLTGLPGCGKSYTGNKLSQQLNFPFFDLDNLIEQKEQKTISAIFTNSGENYFRQLEKKYLGDFITEKVNSGFILSLGGGTICFNGLWHSVKQNGILIYLEATPEFCLINIEKEKEKRPLFSNLNKTKSLAYLSELLEKRKQYYEKADIIIGVNDLVMLEEKIREYID